MTKKGLLLDVKSLQTSIVPQLAKKVDWGQTTPELEGYLIICQLLSSGPKIDIEI